MTLAYSTTQNGTYTTVAQRVTIEGPDGEWEETDATHLDSPNVTARQTILDPGTLNLKCWYDPTDTTHQALTTLYTTGGLYWWKLTFAGTATGHNEVFEGFLKSFSLSGMEATENLAFDAAIRLTTIQTIS